MKETACAYQAPRRRPSIAEEGRNQDHRIDLVGIALRHQRGDRRAEALTDKQDPLTLAMVQHGGERVGLLGQIAHGVLWFRGPEAGPVVDPKGIIATAYHVVDKPTAVARLVMTSDGRAYAIQEILAADRVNDVALVRVDAADLAAATLSAGDAEGTPLTILSHPAAEFYSVTQGLLRRYQSSVALGKQTVQMSVTADFTDGASGGPLFNARGEVAGIVSARRPGTEHELAKIAAPAAAIRALTADSP